MSSSEKYVPKHRAPGAHKRRRQPLKAVRSGAALTGVAAAATGVAVSTGVLSSPPTVPVADASVSERGQEIAQDRLGGRDGTVSRADRRGAKDPVKTAALSTAPGPATTRSERLSEGDPRDIARALLPEYGFSSSQFDCLDNLYVSESDWRIDADNPTSSAYGIPQALTQTHDLPAGYMTSAEVQIRWGLEYIADRYGTPCSAWSFKAANNWY